MNFYEEITDYGDAIANGVYLLNDDKSKMYAYVAPGTGTVKTFKHPISIYIKGRKFKAVKNTWGYKIPGEVAENPRWMVLGSKGDKYYVEQTPTGLTCTCSGFKFRAECKHVKQYQNNVGAHATSSAKGSLATGKTALVKSVKQISRRRTG